MAETFREKEAQRPAERLLPAIRREEGELHSALDSIGRSARHLRIPNESTRPGQEKAIARADFDMRVARNVSELRLEGSAPLHERLLRMLQGII